MNDLLLFLKENMLFENNHFFISEFGMLNPESPGHCPDESRKPQKNLLESAISFFFCLSQIFSDFV